ncbi:MAG: phosphohistidine phosphatase SixA [Planctomycetes bacterium]|nr:phosphohistidine phosphatase SixA [Planctomycetota bacterium]
MRIIIARHAEAEEAGSKPDEERELTEQGRETAKLLGRLLSATIDKIDAVWSSPLPRAIQTARLAAEPFQAPPRLEPELAPGGDLETLCWKLSREADSTVLVVGHQPDLGRLAARLLGLQSAIELKKGGICIVDTRDPMKPIARAVATLQPRDYPSILEGREYAPWLVKRLKL